jgi:hypothetical protein
MKVKPPPAGAGLPKLLEKALLMGRAANVSMTPLPLLWLAVSAPTAPPVVLRPLVANVSMTPLPLL